MRILYAYMEGKVTVILREPNISKDDHTIILKNSNASQITLIHQDNSRHDHATNVHQRENQKTFNPRERYMKELRRLRMQ